VAIGFIAFSGIVSALSAIHGLNGFALVDRAEAGTLTASEIIAYDSLAQGIASGVLVSLIGGAVAFLAWLSRSVDNVPSLGAGRPIATPRWSIGWWFVPIANLFKPYQVVKDLSYRMTSGTNSRHGGIVLAWWIVWIVSGFIALAASRLPSFTAEEFRTWLAAGALADFAAATSAVLAVAVIRVIQSKADARAAFMPAPAGDTTATAELAPCPRCGSARVAGQQFCSVCGLDLWAAYDADRAKADVPPAP
jgi:hypothetical protein